jgi:predicted alpha-1,2-mannosidase
VNRRGSTVIAALASLLLAACGGGGGSGSGSADDDLAAYASPFTGTDADAPDFGTGGGAGNTFPGAVVPFGMLQWSPETVPGKVNSPGGYSYGDTQIRGFGLTHVSGAGCAVLQDFPFLPTTVPVTASPALANSYDVLPAYVPSFSHTGEVAEPGYYRVFLDSETEREIEVELTATTRTGLGRFTFPPTATASILINPSGSAMANGDAVFEIDPERREVSGWVESGQFCYHRNRYTVYFVAEFSRAFAAYGTWTKQELAPGSISASDHAESPFHLRPISAFPDPPSTSNGAQAGAYVTFDTRDDGVVLARVAISYVSVENARENLRAENAGRSFEAIREAARAEWNDLLGRVRVKGGAPEDVRTFYTMLYHGLLGPNVFSDTNGEYAGMDGEVHRADGFTQYTTFSGWDVYRSEIPLLAILVPERASDMMQSLVTNARESGWLPKWSVANGHTDVMAGDPAAPIIAGAHAFGATDFDREAALAALFKGATEEGVSPNAEYVERQALAPYLELGYVPHDGTEASFGGSTSIFGDTANVWGSAATTLEYATADFAISQYAAALGDAENCQKYLRRSAGWKNLFNPATGYIQPRYANGEFLAPFDPASLEGYPEGNGAQYSWMVPHDLAGLAAACGGRAAAAARLDEFFTELNAGPEAPYAYLGNEPCALTPWIFDWLGEPARTQATVRRAILELFNDSPSGYAGNDDLGQMSSWYVFGALGLYPAIPGTDVLALGSPLFEEAVLDLRDGTVTILGRGAGRENPYVQGVTLNGREHTRPWLRFRDLRRGAMLVFDLGPSPTDWGSAPVDVPPSFAPDSAAACAGS